MKGGRGDATVTLLQSSTREPRRLAREADIVVAAAGSRGLVDARWIRPGAVVVDVGMHRGDDGKLAGDVDAVSVGEVASWLSPVPGGVGPMTVACLLANTVESAEKAARRRD
jgi:methylenetetrahydrofolate dehydrogenase (NADP+)/methenyltetrahydrofolate cyclohydrolase